MRQDYQPNFNFNPVISGGETIEIGGNVSIGDAEFGGSSTATGAKTDFGLDLKFGKKLMLMNLANSNEFEVINVSGRANFKEGKTKIGTVNTKPGARLTWGL